MLGWFVAECEVVGKRVNTSKSEAMILTVKGGFPTLDELLPQVEGVQVSQAFVHERGQVGA